MDALVRSALNQLVLREDLDQGLVQQVFGLLMDGACQDIEIAALLTGLAVKGETEAEIAGAAQAMRARASRIPTARTGLLDTCGTGGDHLSTFNISTATAIVVAACGVPVAKHGNRKASSSSGSADVLEALGVNIELSANQAGTCLDEIGICFCYARLMHGAMKHVAPVRTALGIRTIFNFLGPLTNPAQAQFQLLGANRIASAEKLAGAARRLGIPRVFVVCGNDELDEVALWGETTVIEVTGQKLNRQTWGPADFGLPACTAADLHVDSPARSAEVIQGIISGQPGPARNIVVANAAAALLCAGHASDLKSGVAHVQQALDSGTVAQKLEDLIRVSHRLSSVEP